MIVKLGVITLAFIQPNFLEKMFKNSITSTIYRLLPLLILVLSLLGIKPKLLTNLSVIDYVKYATYCTRLDFAYFIIKQVHK